MNKPDPKDYPDVNQYTKDAMLWDSFQPRLLRPIPDDEIQMTAVLTAPGPNRNGDDFSRAVVVPGRYPLKDTQGNTIGYSDVGADGLARSHVTEGTPIFDKLKKDFADAGINVGPRPHKPLIVDEGPCDLTEEQQQAVIADILKDCKWKVGEVVGTPKSKSSFWHEFMGEFKEPDNKVFPKEAMELCSKAYYHLGEVRREMDSAIIHTARQSGKTERVSMSMSHREVEDTIRSIHGMLTKLMQVLGIDVAVPMPNFAGYDWKKEMVAMQEEQRYQVDMQAKVQAEMEQANLAVLMHAEGPKEVFDTSKIQETLNALRSNRNAPSRIEIHPPGITFEAMPGTENLPSGRSLFDEGIQRLLDNLVVAGPPIPRELKIQGFDDDDCPAPMIVESK